MFWRLPGNRRGNISVAFALAALPVAAAVGIAVDYARAYDQEAAAREALALSAREANRLAAVLPADEVEKAAAGIYESAAADVGGRTGPVAVAVAEDGVTLSTRLRVPTTFLGLVGLDEIGFDMSARSVATRLTYEVALVLDTSGAMAGSRIGALRAAAGNLVDALFATGDAGGAADPVRVAVVPFAASVNVGALRDRRSWLSGADRFALFDALTGVSWGGCVEARRPPFDVDDSPADPAVPASLFVPMFAPDEPDLPGFDNSYIADSSPACGLADRRRTTSDRAAVAQARPCKYRQSDPLPEGHRNGTVVGPNLNCTSAPLVSLTADRAVLDAAIGGLRARGLANLAEGLMWGWRALSPGEPFAGGRPYGEPGNRKIIVLMTAGRNAYDAYANLNRSMYGAYGYAADGRLGPATGRASLVAAMNAKTRTACANAKAAGILVYTVAFDVDDPATQALLLECASAPDMAFRSGDAIGLATAVADISNSIAMLRVAD